MPHLEFFLSGIGGKAGKGAAAPAVNKQKEQQKANHPPADTLQG